MTQVWTNSFSLLNSFLSIPWITLGELFLYSMFIFLQPCECFISFVSRHFHFISLAEWMTSVQYTVSCSSTTLCFSPWCSGALQVMEQQTSLLLSRMIISFVKCVLQSWVLKFHFSHSVRKIIWNISVWKIAPHCLPASVSHKQSPSQRITKDSCYVLLTLGNL